MTNSIKYAAFISYRHGGRDQKTAAWLHRAIETYRLPKEISTKLGIGPRLPKLFIDHAELSASSDLPVVIETSLNQSAALIVICSPRARQSKWIAAEIEHFKRIGRRERIFAVLLEGEPDEAFPDSLRFEQNDPNHMQVFEPLAVDLRPNKEFPQREQRRRAILQLVAALVGCEYDQLRLRENERRMRRMMSVAIASLMLLISGLSLAAFALAQRNRALAAEIQTRQLSDQVKNRLSRQYGSEASRRMELGDSLSAMPYSAAAVRESTADSAERLAAQQQLSFLLQQAAKPLLNWNQVGYCRAACFSSDRTYLAAIFEGGSVKVWNLTSAEIVAELDATRDLKPPLSRISFLPDNETIVLIANDTTGRSGPGRMSLWKYAENSVKGIPLDITARASITEDVAAAARDEHPDYVIADAGRISSLAVHRSRNLVAIGADDASVSVIECDSTISNIIRVKLENEITFVAFDEANDRLWALDKRSTLSEIKLSSGAVGRTYRVNALSESQRYAIVDQDEKNSILVDLTTSSETQLQKRLTGRHNVSNSGLLASQLTPNSLEISHLFDDRRAPLRVQLDGALPLNLLRFSGDGLRMYVNVPSTDRRIDCIRILDATTGRSVGPVLNGSEILAISEDEDEICTEHGVWSLCAKDRAATSLPTTGDFTVQVLNDGKSVLVIDDDRGVTELDLEERTAESNLQWVDGGHVMHCSVSIDGSLVAAVWAPPETSDWQIGIWSREERRWLWQRSLSEQERALSGLRLSPLGKWLALESDGFGKSMVLLKASDGTLAWHPEIDEGRVASIRFSESESDGLAEILKWQGSYREPFSQAVDLKAMKLVGERVQGTGILTSTGKAIIQGGKANVLGSLPLQTATMKTLSGGTILSSNVDGTVVALQDRGGIRVESQDEFATLLVDLRPGASPRKVDLTNDARFLISLDQQNALRVCDVATGTLLLGPIANVHSYWFDEREQRLLVIKGQLVVEQFHFEELNQAVELQNQAEVISRLTLDQEVVTSLDVSREKWQKIRESGVSGMIRPISLERERWHDALACQFIERYSGPVNTYATKWHLEKVRFRTDSDMTVLKSNFDHAVADNDWPGVDKTASQLIEAGINNKEVWIERGRARLRRGNFAEAKNDVLNYLRLSRPSPTSVPQPFCMMASICAGLEDADGVKDSLREVHMAFRPAAEALTEEIREHGRYGRDKAVLLLAESLGLDRYVDAEIAHRVGNALACSGRIDDAMQQFFHILQKGEWDMDDYLRFSLCALASNNADLYFKIRRQVLEFEPANFANALPMAVDTFLLRPIEADAQELFSRWEAELQAAEESPDLEVAKLRLLAENQEIDGREFAKKLDEVLRDPIAWHAQTVRAAWHKKCLIAKYGSDDGRQELLEEIRKQRSELEQRWQLDWSFFEMMSQLLQDF